MQFETIQITEAWPFLTITLHRPAHRNSINILLLDELHSILTAMNQNNNCRFIILKGENNIFCTGMDFKEISEKESQQGLIRIFCEKYMSLLKYFTLSEKIIITLLDGQVLAGGLGFVAASDLVLSSQQTQFSLSEALWGLLPACVMPFLIRRIGFQKAYYMTLTTQTMDAKEAQTIGLIDELTEDFTPNLQRLSMRLQRIHPETIVDLKQYFRKLWIITEEMENLAIEELYRLTTHPRIRNNIKNYLENQKFPWEI